MESFEAPAAAGSDPSSSATEHPTSGDWSRRRFLVTAAGAVGAAVGVSAMAASGAAAVSATAGGGTAVSGGSASDLDLLDAMGQAELVRTRKVSALELLDACAARVERVNPQLNAVVSQFLEHARAVARGPLPASPLSGVPYLIKDLVDFKGERFTGGSRWLANNISTSSSPAATAAVKAGLVVFGKTNTCEFGLLPSTESVLLGPVHNPWNPQYSAGGSSGGAAAAVAAGLLPVAHATDAGGSIRMPASCCGVFGLKTSRFRVPNPEPMAGAPDVEFCVSRTVRDSAMMLSLSEDRRRGAPLRPVGFIERAAERRLKIAFCTKNMFGNEPDAEVKAATEAAAKLCSSLGHEILEIANPVDGERFKQHLLTLWATGPQWAVRELKRQHVKPEDVLEPWTLGLAQLGDRLPKSAVPDAIKYFTAFQTEYEKFMASHDVWLTPVLFSPPPRLGELAPTVDFDTLRERTGQYVSYTPVQNVCGAPAMSVPLNWSSQGLPIGTQFAARLGDEATLLSLAYELEAARPWAAKRPALHAALGRLRGLGGAVA